MAFNKYANGAWQKADTAKKYVNGAWQEVGSAKRYTSGAWQELLSSAKYFMRNGVFENGGAYSDQEGWNGVPTVTNGYYTITNNSGGFSQLILKFPKDDAVVGKTLYVICGDRPSSLHLGYNNSGHMWLDYLGSGTYTCTLPSNSDSVYYINFSVDTSGAKLSIKDIYVK